MFCAICGQSLGSTNSACPKCGNGTSAGAIKIAARNSSPGADPRKLAVLLVGFACLLLALLSLAQLSGPAEVVALICIALFFLGWSKRGLGAIPKIFFCVISILLVFFLNLEQNRKVEQKRTNAILSSERQAATLKKLNDDAFAKMSLAQHLSRAQATLKVGSDAATLAMANADLDYLQHTNLAKQAEELRAKYAQSVAVAAEKSAKEKVATAEAINRILRDQMAKSVENSMLDEGYNVDVTAEGPNHTTLRFKWIFVDKVFAHQLSERTEVFENARKVGFKKILATDGYDETWTWNL